MSIPNNVREYKPMPKSAELEFERVFGKKEKRNTGSLIEYFAKGIIAGATGRIPGVLGGVLSQNIQVIQAVNFEKNGIIPVKHRHHHIDNSSKPKHDPGWFTYMCGTVIAAIGVGLLETPIGPVLIGVGTGMMGSGISIAGEAKAAESYKQ